MKTRNQFDVLQAAKEIIPNAELVTINDELTIKTGLTVDKQNDGIVGGDKSSD